MESLMSGDRHTVRNAPFQLELPAQLMHELRHLARDSNHEFATILLGGWLALNGRWRGCDELVVGSCDGVSTRSIRLDIDPTMHELLAQIDAVMSANTPAGVEAFGPSPLAQFLLGSESRYQELESLPVLELTVEEIPTKSGVGGCSLAIAVATGRVIATWNCTAADVQTIERMGAGWQVLLTRLIHGVHQRLSELSILTMSERDKVVSAFNATQIQYPQTELIHEIFAHQVEQTPDAVAVLYEAEPLTYRELSARSNQLAYHLRNLGVRPDQRVAICMERSLEMVVGLLGILKAGGAYVPLDPYYPPDRLAYMLDDAQPSVLLTQEALRERLPPTRAQVIALDGIHNLLGELPTKSLPAQDIGLTPNHLAYVIYTSGSTGRPKGAMNEHRGVVNRLRWMQSAYSLTPADRVLQKTPFSFDVSVWEFFWTLLNGARLVIARPEGHKDPGYLRRVIEAAGVTRLHFVPSMLQAFLSQHEVGLCPSIVQIVCSGEELSAGLQRKCFECFPQARLSNLYGPTEAAVDVTSWECQPGDQESRVPIGRPISNTQIYILDSRRQPVPIGVSGEIYIGGVAVGRGYLHQPQLTEQRFVPDPFSSDSRARLYKTGDLGRWRPDGAVEYLGRNDHQTKIRGFRIELGEIEAQLLSHPAVREAIVLAREDIPGEKQLIGYLTLDREQLSTLQPQDAGPVSKEIVDKWKQLYEETYSTGASGSSFAGWNSSYTGLPIPEEQMHEWVQATVERIRDLRSRRVLEVGCGVGLLLQALAPECQAYHASDLSSAALRRLHRWIDARPDCKHVQLEECAALDLKPSAAGAYDTVILNSVIQYFPDVEYLRSVLEHAVEWVRPGGTIFVGDVRHFGLLAAFHASVQLARAEPGSSATQLRARVERAVELEKELVVDPGFFEQLPAVIPGIASVKILLRRGRSDNEMTRYRYDIVLQTSAPMKLPAAPVSEGLDWVPGAASMERVCRLLEEERPPFYRISAVDNSRCARDAEAARLIRDADGSTTAAMLRKSLGGMEFAAEDPESFWELGNRFNYDVEIGWHPGGTDGRFDVQLIDASAVLPDTSPSAERPQLANGLSLAQYATDPAKSTLQRELLAQLRKRLHERLPSYMVPGALVLIQQLPLTPNGKLDRKALPAPDANAYGAKAYVPPTTSAERLLAQLWQELLRVSQVGRDDGFFELGGHSLLIVQMLDRLRRSGLHAQLRDVYERPTLKDLASSLQQSVDEELIDPLPGLEISPEESGMLTQAVSGGARNIQAICPLAPLQMGILFHHTLQSKGGDPYVLPTLMVVPSRKILDRLISALQSVIDRHDALRSAVFWENLPHPVQVFQREAALAVEEISLTPGVDPEQELMDRMRPERQRIDLRLAPLMRLEVAADPSSSRWYAVLQLHHLACDYQSLEMLLAEVALILADRASELPAAVSYRAHVERASARARANDSRAFFTRKLGAIDEPTAPFGLLNVHGDGTRSAEARLTLDRDLSRRIRARAGLLSVSAATLIHAAWALVVARTSARDDVIFGTVLLGRFQSTGLEQMLGMTINTLPLLLRLEGLTVRDLIEHTQRGLLELLDHEQASLAEAQQCSLVRGGPLFSALLNYRHGKVDATNDLMTAAGISVRRSQSWTNYPVVMCVDDSGDAIDLSAQTDRRIDPGRLTSYLSKALESLVDALEDAPDERALLLSVLPQSERMQSMQDFRHPTVAYPQDGLVHEIFQEQVDRFPDEVAIVLEPHSLTYSELDRRANQLARLLRTRSIGPDQRVGILLERGPDMVVSLLGTLKAGGAYVPLDPAWPTERLEFILSDCTPPIVVTQESLRDRLPAGAAEVIVLDRQASEIAAYSPSRLDPGIVGSIPSHLAYLIYTSGSTGLPKGVMVEHRNVTRLFKATEPWFQFSHHDVWSLFHSFAFDFSVWEMWGALLYGGRVVIVPQATARSPKELYRLLCRQKVTVLSQTPGAFSQLISEQERNPLVQHSLRFVVFGGESLEMRMLRPWAARNGVEHPQLINMYGITETTVHVTYHRITLDQIESEKGSIVGLPIPDLRVFLLNRHQQPVPLGVVGEIHVGGAGVTRGYLNRAELTRQRFIADPYSDDPSALLYRSGDLARWRPDGFLEYVGRNDQQVKIRGYRIELGEIENQLTQHAQVREAAVLAREHSSGEKRLVAYIVPHDQSRPGGMQSIEILRAHLRDHLPEYMVPSAFVLLERMPLTSNGKLDKRALPEPDPSAQLGHRYEDPRGEVEQILAGLLQPVLRVDRVGRDDSFFDLGGHSLLAMQAVTRIRSVFSVDLPVSALFELPTVRGLAAYIDRHLQELLLAGMAQRDRNIEKLLQQVDSMESAQVEELVRKMAMGTKS